MASGKIPKLGAFSPIGSIPGNSSKIFAFGSSTQHLCLVCGAYSGHHALFLVTCDSGGNANISIIYKASSITITGGTRQVTVSSTQAGTASLYDCPIVGAAMVVSE